MNTWTPESGIELRDYFAAAALTGLLSQHGSLNGQFGRVYSEKDAGMLAADAYKIAIAMEDYRASLPETTT